jgi:hypothetical protein
MLAMPDREFPAPFDAYRRRHTFCRLGFARMDPICRNSCFFSKHFHARRRSEWRSAGAGAASPYILDCPAALRHACFPPVTFCRLQASWILLDFHSLDSYTWRVLRRGAVMPARKSFHFLKSSPSNLRSSQGKIPAAEAEFRVEEPRRAYTETTRTLNVYEKTGSYRFLRVFRRPAGRLQTLKTKGLHRSFIGYINDRKKGC